MLNKIDLHDRLKCIDVLSIEKKEWEAYRIHEEWSHRHPNPKLDSPLFQAAKEYDANAKKIGNRIRVVYQQLLMRREVFVDHSIHLSNA